MIIKCINCNKKFNVEDQMIPEKGRTIQCGSCKDIWFFKKDVSHNSLENNDKNIFKEVNSEIKKKNDEIVKEISSKLIEPEEITNQEINIKETKREITSKKLNTLNKIVSYLIVAIISFVAFVIVLDTFKTPLSNVFPNLELLLFNLYETFEDIGLFLKDLIK